MSKHYLLQKQKGIIIKKTVKDWAREPQNQKKFPKYSFQRPYNTDTTPTSEEIDGISGVTSYQVDLSDLENVSEKDSFINTLSSFFVTKVYADSDNVSTNSTWDKSISVKLNMTVNWKKYDSGHINITNVSGGYSRSDSTVSITGSSVFVIQGMTSDEQSRTFNPGTRNSWSYPTGFSKVGNTGWPTRKYAEYTVYLKRGSSTWQVELGNYLGGYDEAS